MTNLTKFTVNTLLLCVLGMVACVAVARYALNEALVGEAHSRGMDWAHYIEENLSRTGLENSAHLEANQQNHSAGRAQNEEVFRNITTGVFGVGNIFQIDYVPLWCDCSISLSTADHPNSGMGHAGHHGHGHSAVAEVSDVGDATLKGASGMGDGAQQTIKSGKAPVPLDQGTIELVSETNAHNILIKSGTSPDLPSTFAEVFHPVQSGQEQAYVLRVLVDLDDQVVKYWRVLGVGVSVSLIVLVLAVGYPAAQFLKSVKRQQEIDQKAAYLANFDVLTNLPNRNNFSETVDDILWECRRDQKAALVYIFDLNGFKDVNDYFGHDVGDQLLCAFANLLMQHVPDEAFVARLGGDEFVVVIGGLTATTSLPAQLPDFPKKVSMTLPNFRQVVSAGISGGAAWYPRDAEEKAELLQCADLALYAAKANRLGEICAYTPELRADFENRLTIADDFRTALEASQIEPYYQPIVNIRTGEVAGFEALTRWCHPEKGVLAPDYFGSALQDNEITQLLGQQMLSKVVRDMADWKDINVGFGKVAINVAAGDLLCESFSHDALEQLDSFGLHPSNLMFEVTETCLYGGNKNGFINHLETLRRAGCDVALDDFGTGYSSITQLKEVPITKVKIDKSFLDDILDNGDDQSIVRALLEMSHSIGFDVVLEGVEQEAQAGFIKELGGELMQGYLFAKPMPRSSVPGFLEAYGQGDATNEKRFG